MRVLALIALIGAFFAAPALAQPKPAKAVGFQYLTIADPAGPEVEIGVWYPTEAAAAPRPIGLLEHPVAKDAPVAGAKLPLVVMSHGNGGSFSGHVDTALALARAGFVVAALTHTGDNYHDQSLAVNLPNRPRQLKLLTDYMLQTWRDRAVIDPNEVGAFGFSAGGFTVLTAIGGEADLSKTRPHCVAHPTNYDCVLVGQHRELALTLESKAVTWVHDPRIKAAIIAAPAMGFAFGREGLTGVHIPVQLWRAELDHILPHPDYAEAVRLALPTAPDYHLAAGADHFDFLAPCTEALRAAAPFICVSPAGFDRIKFHEAFNREVVAFFTAKLSPSPQN